MCETINITHLWFQFYFSRIGTLNDDKRQRQKAASHFLYIETISDFKNYLQLKTTGKSWKDSANRPPHLKVPRGRRRCDLPSALNSERSLLFSRPWLPKINYSDPNLLGIF